MAPNHNVDQALIGRRRLESVKDGHNIVNHELPNFSFC